MKSTWKDALYISFFEFRTQFDHIFYGWLLIILFGVILISPLSSYLMDNFTAYDFIFSLFMIGLTYWFRPRSSLIQLINSETQLAPFALLLAELPINKKVFIRSRLVSYYVYFLPIIFIVMFPLYLFDGRLHQSIPFKSFIVFLFVWVAIISICGLSLVATEVGMNGYLLNSLLGLVIVGSLLLFQHYTNQGFVAWTVEIAIDYPVYTLFLSIVTCIIGWQFWQTVMIRKVEKIDYL